MASGAYILADIGKIAQFEKKSREAINEFSAIKSEFHNINNRVLSKWKGKGADEFRKEVDHILEKIGGIKDILDSINNGTVKDVKDNYMKLDQDLSDFNKDPQSGQ